MAIANADKKVATEATLREVRDSLAGAGDNSDVVDKLDEVITELQATHTVTIDGTSITALADAYDTANDQIEASLQDVADTLSDILGELLQKIEAGDEIGLTGDAIDALAAAVAALYAFPVDYPDAGALAKLEQMRVLLAALNPLTDTQLRAAAVPTRTVAAAPTLVSGTLAAGTGTGDIISSTASSGPELLLQYGASTISCTVIMQGSNDGTNWKALAGRDEDAPSGSWSIVGLALSNPSNAANARLYRNPYAFWRLTCTVHASGGPLTFYVNQLPASAADQSTRTVSGSVSVSNTPTVNQGSANATAWHVQHSGANASRTTFTATTSTTILAAASGRKEFILRNKSDKVCYVALGGGPVTATDFTIDLQPGETFIEDHFTGTVIAMMASAPTSGTVMITSITQ